MHFKWNSSPHRSSPTILLHSHRPHTRSTEHSQQKQWLLNSTEHHLNPSASSHNSLFFVIPAHSSFSPPSPGTVCSVLSTISGQPVQSLFASFLFAECFKTLNQQPSLSRYMHTSCMREKLHTIPLRGLSLHVPAEA